ncbi:hypothetical protein [Geodermatophilus sp. URMC 63]
MVGADLANLLNEVALLAARREREQVRPADLQDALEKVLLGSARGIMLTPEERRRTAVHEAGHALLGMLTPGTDPVGKVSIIPRGRALGVTLQSPEADRYGWSEDFLRGRITGALGGRAAEQVVFGEVTTGAESDLEQSTRIARSMVGRGGMSAAVGPVTVRPAPGQETPFGEETASPGTRLLVDEEVRRLVERCSAEAVEILRGHRAQLDALAARLLEAETWTRTRTRTRRTRPPASPADRPSAPGPARRSSTRIRPRHRRGSRCTRCRPPAGPDQPAAVRPARSRTGTTTPPGSVAPWCGWSRATGDTSRRGWARPTPSPTAAPTDGRPAGRVRTGSVRGTVVAIVCRSGRGEVTISPSGAARAVYDSSGRVDGVAWRTSRTAADPQPEATRRTERPAPPRQTGTTSDVPAEPASPSGHRLTNPGRVRRSDRSNGNTGVHPGAVQEADPQPRVRAVESE